MLADDLPELKSPYPAGRKPEWAGTTWSPTFEVGDNEGEVRSVPHAITDTETDDADMLTEVGLDPTVWEVVSRRESRWQRHDGEWLQAFKLTVRRRGAGASDLTVDRMSEILKSYRSRPRTAETTSGTLLVGVADLQVGKNRWGRLRCSGRQVRPHHRRHQGAHRIAQAQQADPRMGWRLCRGGDLSRRPSQHSAGPVRHRATAVVPATGVTPDRRVCPAGE